MTERPAATSQFGYTHCCDRMLISCSGYYAQREHPDFVRSELERGERRDCRGRWKVLSERTYNEPPGTRTLTTIWRIEPVDERAHETARRMIHDRDIATTTPTSHR